MRALNRVFRAKTINTQHRGVAFSIRQLFANGEPGVWYDPSDMTTLFQNAAGTTPVTAVEQPVGLMLDKSKGLVLGSELVTNGGPSFVNTTGWTSSKATVSVVDGRLRIANTSTSLGVGQVTIPTVAGKHYEIAFSYVLGATSSNFRVGSTSLNTDLYSASVSVATKVIVAATTTTTYLNWRVNEAASGAYIDIASVSVRELPGNHAYQTTTTSRPVLSARYNLLTKTEQFDDVAWVKVSSTVTANAVVAPDGTPNADTLVEDTTASVGHALRQNVSVTTGVAYTMTAYVKAAGRTWFAMQGNASNLTGLAYYDLQNGVLGDVASGTTASITSVGNGWYRCSWTRTATATQPVGFLFYAAAANSQVTYTGDGTSGIYIWGASLVPADQASLPYQRVNTVTDYDTVGFPHYLRFIDDDWLVTNTITPGTDKAQVFAGVRKISDAARAMISELSDNGGTNFGAFILDGPGLTPSTDSYRFVSTGTTFGVANTGTAYPAPITNVLTGLGDISGDSTILRVNGTQAASSTSDQGTGNYLAYPLYIGRRGGTTLPFNGHLYSLIVRFGANLEESKITEVEKYLNYKTLAFDYRDITDSSSFRWNSATASPDAE